MYPKLQVAGETSIKGVSTIWADSFLNVYTALLGYF